MNIELHVDPPKFQVNDWVRLSHPLSKKKTVGKITQIRCLVTIFTVKSPPEFEVSKLSYAYFLHNINHTFFAEDDLSSITAEVE